MQVVPAKTILSSYSEGESWFGFHYNMNLYRGCCHGCIYCDSRSDCYRVEDFDTVRAKANAIELLQAELRSRKKPGIVASGAMSDPYNPFEKQLQLTRQSLQVIDRSLMGAAVITKSDLVLRDADVFRSIQAHSPVLVLLTVTTVDDDLARLVEPHAPPPSDRFAACRILSDYGIFTGILMTPVLPFIEDSGFNIRTLVQMAAQSGAKFVYPTFGVTLRSNQRDYFYDRLDENFPGLKQQYIETFGDTYLCTSPDAHKLSSLFQKECERTGLLYRMPDIIRASRRDYEIMQTTLF